MSDEILSRVNAQAVDGQISCAAAHRIAAELGVTPGAVGAAVNRDGTLRFYRCQMGFFGYGVKAEGTHRIVQPAAHVPDDVRVALEAHVADGRISCADAWRVAEQFEYPYLAISNVIERLGYRVKPCQLGCF
jgi:hypothetical protein